MEKFPMSAPTMSRWTIRACLGIHLKNRRKKEFMQQRVKNPMESTKENSRIPPDLTDRPPGVAGECVLSWFGG